METLFGEAIDSYFSNPADKFLSTYPGEFTNKDSESVSVGEGIALTRRRYPLLHTDTTTRDSADWELGNSTQPSSWSRSAQPPTRPTPITLSLLHK